MTTTYVMVTFNRLELLKQTLNSVFDMNKKFDNIIIVNCNSSDGTKEYLDSISKLHNNIMIFNLEKNIGGSGGFSFGVQQALINTKSDWLFLADDDAVPDKNMLLNLEETYNNLENKDEIAALCTSVYNNGKIDISHRRNIKKSFLKLEDYNIPESRYCENFYVEQISFVGLLVKRNVVKQIGLPIGEFFIYYDDTEYSYRINKVGKILCVPNSIMNHNIEYRLNKGITWRDFYLTRNKIYVVKKYYSKRYYKFLVFKFWKRYCFLRKFIKKVSDNERKLLKIAVKDGKNGKLGIHSYYNPTNKNI